MQPRVVLRRFGADASATVSKADPAIETGVTIGGVVLGGLVGAVGGLIFGHPGIGALIGGTAGGVGGYFGGHAIANKVNAAAVGGAAASMNQSSTTT